MPIAVVFAMASSRSGVAVLVTCFVSTIVLGTGVYRLPSKTGLSILTYPYAVRIY